MGICKGQSTVPLPNACNGINRGKITHKWVLISEKNSIKLHESPVYSAYTCNYILYGLFLY